MDCLVCNHLSMSPLNLEISIKIKSQPSIPKSNPECLLTGENLGKTKHTMTIKTLKNGGYIISKSQNKK